MTIDDDGNDLAGILNALARLGIDPGPVESIDELIVALRAIARTRAAGRGGNGEDLDLDAMPYSASRGADLSHRTTSRLVPVAGQRLDVNGARIPRPPTAGELEAMEVQEQLARLHGAK